MKYFIMLKRNFQKRKKFSAIIAILAFVASVFLIMALGIMQKTGQIYHDSYQKAGEADLIYGFNKQLYQAADLTYFEEQESVSQVAVETALFGNLNLNGEDEIPTVFAAYQKLQRNYTLTKDIQELKANQIVLPLNFQTEYNLSVGDTIVFEGMTFEIASFFEDPIYGSPFYHTKRVLLAPARLAQLENNLTDKSLHPLVFLNVTLDSQLSASELKKNTKEIINGFPAAENSLFAFEKNNLETVRTIVPRIILAVLLVFALFLLIIMVIVIRYTIMASVEDDYTSLGIMKALGFKSRQISILLLTQYLALVLAGCLLGMVLAYGLVPPVGKYLLNSSGILWVGTINPFVTFALVLGLLLFVGLIVFSQVGQVKRIKPLEAIVTGRKGVSQETNAVTLTDGKFFSRLPLFMRLAAKQFISGFRQYVSLLFLITIFAFMILTVLSLRNTFGTAESVSRILGYEINDIHVEVTDEGVSNDTMEKVFQQLDQMYDVTYLSSFDSRYKAYVAGDQTQLLVNSQIDGENLIAGKIPQNADEIVISHGVQEMLGKGLGDTLFIAIEKNGPTHAYKIVGINNKVYNLGSNITMLAVGLEKLVPNYSPLEYYVKISDTGQIHAALKSLKDNALVPASSLNVTDEREAMLKRIQAIQNVFAAIALVVVVISLALIALITLLVALVITKREVFNFGIMKAIGFTSSQIRWQLLLRFFLVSGAAVVLGTSLYLLSNNGLVNALFSVVKIAKIPAGTTLNSYIFSTFFILFMTSVSTWFVSGNVKTVQVKDLIKD